MTREDRAQGPASTTSPDHHTAEVRHRTEERVLEVLAWHPDVAAGLIDRIDPDLFADPVLGALAAEILDVYRQGVDLGSGTVLEVVTGRAVRDAYGLDRPDGIAATVWGPRAVADLAEVDRVETLRRRLVLAVDDLDRRRPPDQIAGRLRRVADELEEVSRG